MSIKEELLFDFGISMPRIVIGGNIIIIDYVKRIAGYSDEQILLHNGKQYICICGNSLVLKEIRNERVLITGELEEVGFFETLCDIGG